MEASQLSDAFYLDLAVGVVDFQSLCLLHGVDADEVSALEDDIEFRTRATRATQAVEDTGQSFRARCRQMANRHLITLEDLLTDPEIAPSVRLDAFKTLTRLGALEAPKQDMTSLAGPQLVLNIMAPDGSVGFSANLVAPVEPELLTNDQDDEA